jgi:hypothetical protein
VAATGTATVAPLLQATRAVPIVFVTVIDPVGAGFVASLARPDESRAGDTAEKSNESGVDPAGTMAAGAFIGRPPTQSVMCGIATET